MFTNLLLGRRDDLVAECPQESGNVKIDEWFEHPRKTPTKAEHRVLLGRSEEQRLHWNRWQSGTIAMSSCGMLLASVMSAIRKRDRCAVIALTQLTAQSASSRPESRPGLVLTADTSLR